MHYIYQNITTIKIRPQMYSTTKAQNGGRRIATARAEIALCFNNDTAQYEIQVPDIGMYYSKI